MLIERLRSVSLVAGLTTHWRVGNVHLRNLSSVDAVVRAFGLPCGAGSDL